MRFMDIAYCAFAVMPFRFPRPMWLDDTIVILERVIPAPSKGFCWTSGHTY